MIKYPHLIIAAAAFLLLVWLKAALNLNLRVAFVKYFHWLPSSSLLSRSTTKLAGLWNQSWSGEAGKKQDPASVSSATPITLKQFGPYCYGEFYSGKSQYVVTGKVKGNNFIGEWYDRKNRAEYFGTFDLQVVDGNRMTGKWTEQINQSSTVWENHWKR